MKLKVKPAYLGLFMIVVMLSSTLAYGILQAIYYPAQEKIELPSSNVIDYQLTTKQETVLMKQGKIVVLYLYNLTCANCLYQRQFLEQLTTQSKLKDQLFLQTILTDEKGKLPKITAISYNGQKDLLNATDEEVIDTLCKLATNPPVECALRQL